VERRPHRNQRMILRHPHRVLSLPLSFPRSVFRLSISCMGCERSSGCCVILRSCFIGATSNLFPPLFYARRRHPPTSFISHGPPLWISSRVCVFLPSLPRRCVSGLSSSLALAPIICSYYFLTLTRFVVYIFHPTFLLLLCLYSPLDHCPPVILCYLTCIPSRRH
jgi:hypothetical protein